MAQIRTILLFLTGLVVVTLYNNCSEMQFESSAGSEPTYRALANDDMTFEIPEVRDPDLGDGDKSPESLPPKEGGRSDDDKDCDRKKDERERPRKDRVCKVRKALAKAGYKVERHESCSDESNSSNECQVICHKPPGNPGNAHEIKDSSETHIMPSAKARAHLKNHEGDHLGPCEENLPPQPENCEDEEDDDDDHDGESDDESDDDLEDGSAA